MAQQVQVSAASDVDTGAAPGGSVMVVAQVANTGSDTVPSATVTVSAQPGLTFLDDALYAGSTGQQEPYLGQVDPAQTTLTVRGVRLNLQPGQTMELSAFLSVAPDASAGALDVSFRIGEPVLGKGQASVQVFH